MMINDNTHKAFAIPSYIRLFSRLLKERGHTAYLVGGCVRDMLLGETPKDYDMTTSALPEEICAAFEGSYTVIKTGLKHGTVTVLYEKEPVEITTYRVDGTYSDARRPDSVRFTDRVEEDLSRRDFTVNAMAFDPETGLLDLFGGREDLQNKVLRCVGRAETRFTEDALRMLRALRFSARLDFDIDEEAAKAIHFLKERLGFVSAERIASEMRKCFESAHPARLEKLLCDYTDVLDVIMPEGAASLTAADCRDMALIAYGSDTRLAYLAFCTGTSASLGGYWKLSAALSRFIEGFGAAFPEVSAVTDRIAARRFAHRFGFPVSEAAAAAYWDITGIAVPFSLTGTVKSEGDCVTLDALAVNGKDLKALGFNGPAVGEALAFLLESVMADAVMNDRGALIAYMNKHITSM